MMRWSLVALLVVLFAPPVRGQEEDEPGGSECEICGAFVPMPHQTYLSGNTRYIYLDKREPRRFCNACQRDINSGKIDPDNPPLLAPRDETEELTDNPHGNKWAVEELDLGERKPVPKDEEAHSGFGALGYTIAIVVALGAALRFFLKS